MKKQQDFDDTVLIQPMLLRYDAFYLTDSAADTREKEEILC